ncbi:hypothetical protein SUDANB96_06107 [Streptomyces sp. enrichment culture]
MTTPSVPGREAHLRTLTSLPERAAALVVTGEPGIGRTTLLDHAAHTFTAGPVLRLRADHARGRRPYEGLRAVARAVTDAWGPRGVAGDERAREPFGAAGGEGWAGVTGGEGWAGVTGGEGWAGVLVAALRGAAAGGPLLLCVDDVHLWDGPSRAALARVARRLPEAGRVGLLLSAAGFAPRELAGLPALPLRPLSSSAGSALLDEVADAPVDPAVRDRLLEESEGNPALLLALTARLTPGELCGRHPLPRPLADPATLAAVAGPRLHGLPPHAARLLLVTAAALRATEGEEVDATLVAEASAALEGSTAGGVRGGLGAGEGVRAAGCGGPRPAGGLAAPRDGGAPPGEPSAGLRRVEEALACADGLAQLVDGRLRLVGAVLRRAVYAAAAPGPRGDAHRSLARVLDGNGDRLRALLHRGWAAAGPDAGLAAELTGAAADPRTPVPHRLRSLAHARAAELAADEATRARCRTAAAEEALRAGSPGRALELLGEVARQGVPDGVRGRAELLRGAVQWLDGPLTTARESLLTAATLLADPAPTLAALASARAGDAAWAAGDLHSCLEILTADPANRDTRHRGPSGREEGRAGEVRVPPVPRASDDLRFFRLGLRAVLEGRREGAVGPLRRVVEGARERADAEGLLRAAAAALVLGDVAAASRAAARAVAVATADGDLVVVPRALEFLAYAELRSGRHPQARAHAEEGLRAARRAGQRNTAAGHHAVLALAASIEGETAAVAGHAAAALATARRHGLAQTATLAQWASGRADLGRGRPLEAADRLGPLVRPGPRRGHFAVWMLALPCFVEAAVLAGRPAQARGALEDLAAWAAFGADPQAPAQLLRCRALLAPPDLADELYTRALDQHERTAGDFERARTELLYGKWLRRRRRLREARDRLGAALVGFESCGARVWAEQTRGELRAQGGAPDAVPSGALSRLTPQQCRIARHVADGATNREVARILSVSTRTVDYHLRNVFAALGVRSRVELARLVEQAQTP